MSTENHSGPHIAEFDRQPKQYPFIERISAPEENHHRASQFSKYTQGQNSSPIREDLNSGGAEKSVSPPMGEPIGDPDNLDLNFTSKLPAITELVNLRNKYISIFQKQKARQVDPSVNVLIMNLTKYAQNLEHVIRFKNKEIQRLEYINKYLVISQQKRDEMLTHILEENRKLKELSTRSEKKNDKRIPPINLAQSPKIGTRPIPQQSQSQSLLKTPSDRRSTTLYLPKTSLDRRGTAIGPLKMKPDLPNMRPVEKDKGLNPNILKTGKKLLDEKKTQSILKMTEEDVNAMYAESESLMFLDRLLMRANDGFTTEVRSFEDPLLFQLYDSILQLRTDHKALMELVFKLKKILKAATTMTTSLVLSEAMERIVDETCECLSCERATTFLYDITKDQLWSKAAKGSVTIRVPANKGIVGHVFMKGEPLNILNAYADDRFNKEFDMRSGFKTNTILAVPIKDQTNKVIGVCQAINKKGHNAYFSKDDEGLLTILSTLAGVVLKNSMTYDEQVTFLNSLRKSLQTGVTLLAQQELKTLIPLSIKMLKTIMGVEQARVVFKHPKKKDLYSIDDEGELVSYPQGSGIIGKVMETCDNKNITNAYADPSFNGQVDIETSMPVMCVPIKYPNTEKSMGAIQVINSRGIQGLSATHKAKVSGYDLETLEFFARQIAQSVMNCYRWERQFFAARGEKYPFDPENGEEIAPMPVHDLVDFDPTGASDEKPQPSPLQEKKKSPLAVTNNQTFGEVKPIPELPQESSPQNGDEGKKEKTP